MTLFFKLAIAHLLSSLLSAEINNLEDSRQTQNPSKAQMAQEISQSLKDQLVFLDARLSELGSKNPSVASIKSAFSISKGQRNFASILLSINDSCLGVIKNKDLVKSIRTNCSKIFNKESSFLNSVAKLDISDFYFETTSCLFNKTLLCANLLKSLLIRLETLADITVNVPKNSISSLDWVVRLYALNSFERIIASYKDRSPTNFAAEDFAKKANLKLNPILTNAKYSSTKTSFRDDEKAIINYLLKSYIDWIEKNIVPGKTGKKGIKTNSSTDKLLDTVAKVKAKFEIKT